MTEPPKEDLAHLIKRARDGSAEAFGEIYRLYYRAIFRYARYRLGEQAAEDAVAETFLRAWQGLSRYRPTGAPFVSWLYGIARHVVLDAINLDRLVEPRSEFLDISREPPLSATDRIALADAVQSLPVKQRQVIELKFLLGMTNQEVGAVMNKSPGAVNAQQWRAMEGLRKMLWQQEKELRLQDAGFAGNLSRWLPKKSPSLLNQNQWEALEHLMRLIEVPGKAAVWQVEPRLAKDILRWRRGELDLLALLNKRGFAKGIYLNMHPAGMRFEGPFSALPREHQKEVLGLVVQLLESKDLSSHFGEPPSALRVFARAVIGALGSVGDGAEPDAT